MTALILIGAGGHGKVVADTAEACGFAPIAFVDQAWPVRQQNGRWPVVAAIPPVDATLFCAIGNNRVRAGFFDRCDLTASPVLADPFTRLSTTARFGAGTLIVAGSVVNADTEVGRGVILNTGCSVDHDCRIGDFAHISPGARLAGGVTVGARSWIGIGAAIREGITIGEDVMIAAGAAVISDVPSGQRIGGVPARPI